MYLESFVKRDSFEYIYRLLHVRETYIYMCEKRYNLLFFAKMESDFRILKTTIVSK